MKKFVIVILCFCFSLCLSGCSDDKNVIKLDEYNYLDYIDVDTFAASDALSIEFTVKPEYEIVDDIAINYSIDWVFKTVDPFNSGLFGKNGTSHESGTVDGRIKISKDNVDKNGFERHYVGLSSSIGVRLYADRMDIKHVEGKVKVIEKD